MSSSASTTPGMVPALITTPLVIVAAVFPVLSFACIILRYKARQMARQPLQSDDYTIVLSWVLGVIAKEIQPLIV